MGDRNKNLQPLTIAISLFLRLSVAENRGSGQLVKDNARLRADPAIQV